MAATNGTTRVALWVGALASVALAAYTFVQSTTDRLTKIEVSLNEIETQFCAEDIVRNLMHANDLRNTSILWEKQFGTKYPTDNAYYPTICNRRTKNN
jgi:hypothetical protein